MIVVTLGTHEQPFDRALDLVEPLTSEHEVLVQHGHTPPRSSDALRWLEFTGPTELEQLMHEANAVVCHAGVGSIMSALAAGHTPVVIARRREFGEHVDNHQSQIADAFERLGYVVAHRDGADLSQLVRQAQRQSRPPSAGGDLRRAVQAASRGEN